MLPTPADFHSSLEDPKRSPKAEKTSPSISAGVFTAADVRYLIGVVVQLQDARAAARAIEMLGLKVTNLPSTGAFLGRRNVTMLIGVPEGYQQRVYDAIHETCHQRIEYVSTPLEGAPMPIPLSTPITVGGATIFTMEIQRYEEF